MELNHLSYSSISTWLICPRSWKYKYIEKVPTSPSPALVFGSAVHDTIEEYVGETERRYSLAELWPFKWQAQLELNPDIIWSDETPEGLHNDGLRLLSAPDVVTTIDGLNILRDDNGPYIERKIELRVPDVPIPIIGYIDLMAEDGVPMDLKTSSKSWNADKASSETQPLFYLAALMQAGNTTHRMRFRHIVLVKTKTPQIQILESTFTIGNIFWLLEMIHTVWGAIREGHFPCNPTGWKCSSTWCEYWSMCRGRT